MKTTLLLMLSISMLGLANEGWVPHLIGASRLFQSDLVLENHARNSATIDFFNERGDLVDSFEVAANASMTVPGYSIGSGHTHLYYEASTTLLEARLRYRSQLYANTVQVNLPAATGKSFHFAIEPARQTWLGLAFVNSGQHDGSVNLTTLDVHGESIGLVEMTHQLKPGEKFLYTLEGRLLQGATSMAVSSSEPIAMLVLQGSGSNESSQLREVTPMSVWSDRIEVRIQGGFLFVDERVVIEDGFLSFQGVTVALPSDHQNFEKWLTSGFLDYQIEPVKDPCCDFRFYSAELISGDSGNAVLFSDVDVDSENGVATSTQSLIRDLVHLAQELTGKRSIVFPLD